MANAKPVTATEQTTVDHTAPAEITKVEAEAAPAPKAAKAKEKSEDFSNGIKRETY